MEEKKGSNPYTSVIDLTSRAQEARRRERDLKDLQVAEENVTEITLERLPPGATRAAQAAGWSSLMPVQQRAIPFLIDRKDLIVQARTGSGKTGAFLLPLFDSIDVEKRDTQTIILTPTRELARQIHAEFQRLCDGSCGIRTALLYGGVRYGPQLKDLDAGPHVVIGTPGRILDHLERRNLRLDRLDMLVLDEADEMLSMGFYPAMRKLQRYLPDNRTSYMFSATMPGRVRGLAKEFLDDPVFLALSAGAESVDTMDTFYYVVGAMDKDRALVRLIDMENPDAAIIFANTKRDVEYLAQFLQNYGHDADAISGDLSQAAREKVMEDIKRERLRFLVATDVAARGIDISHLGHVFMYDVPQDQEYFLHRSGRTARAGAAGTVIVLTTVEDERKLEAMAQRYSVKMEKRSMPTADEVDARVSERLTVLLEDRFRGKSNLERERQQHFESLVGDLAREEPELLAMLIDEFYHHEMHKRSGPRSEGEKSDDRSEEKKPSRKSSGKRGRGRR